MLPRTGLYELRPRRSVVGDCACLAATLTWTAASVLYLELGGDVAVGKVSLAVSAVADLATTVRLYITMVRAALEREEAAQ